MGLIPHVRTPLTEAMSPLKLYEYLAAGRPILVLGDQTEAARIVSEAGAGFAAPAGDPEAIASALRRLVTEPPAPTEPERIRQFEYPALVDRMAAVIDRVASRPAT